jgi:serine/threonine-protein kinase
MRLREDQATAVAMGAAARGWIESDLLWDLAARASRGEPTAEILAEMLAPEQLDELADLLGTEGVEAWPLSIPPPAGVPSSGVPSPRSGLRSTARGAGERYRREGLLGRGGGGEVVAARDSDVGRVVALKTLSEDARDEKSVERFFMEARVTAQLEHPNIVPVYEVGTAPDGAPFYTMRLVKSRSLARVIGTRSWPLVRMLGAFVQVCRALAYAHSRGVLHGDVKPENILLGDFGEVYLADWGLMKVAPHSALRPSRPPSPEDARSLLSLVPGPPKPTQTTSRCGMTPGFAAPEVVFPRGHVDHRADLFSLGVVLYEILTGEHPFERSDAWKTLLAAVREEPVPPRKLEPTCPLLLDDLCLELLAKNRDARPASADEVAERIEGYLEGAKERERRREEAQRLSLSARAPAEKFASLEREREALSQTAREMLREVEPWEPVERKRAAWDVEQRAAAADREAARALAEAIELYTKSLGYDADCRAAHEGLAELYWSRASRAADERRQATRVYYETLALEHDVAGRYAAVLGAPAALSLRSHPEGARCRMFRYEERDRILVAVEPRDLGACPVDLTTIEQGSYLVVLSLPGFRDVRYPVLLERGERHAASVNLYTDEEIGEDFIYVPAGSAILGGDPDAVDPIPLGRHYVGDFAIARFPVTTGSYCAFLDALGESDPGAVLRRAPHDLRGSEGLGVVKGSDGRWTPYDQLIEGETRRLFPKEKGHFLAVPAMLIDWFDASAYACWLGGLERDGLRLPTELEWEKAARGTDGRLFPWGNDFDATFCKMRDSRPFVHQPEPVGTFPRDESPYGVRDLAGGMREWVADVFGQATAEECAAQPEPAASTERGASSMRLIRGGGWNTAAEYTRAASRGAIFSLSRGTTLGFRLAKSLTPRKR